MDWAVLYKLITTVLFACSIGVSVTIAESVLLSGDLSTDKPPITSANAVLSQSSYITNNNQPKEEGYFKGFNGYEWGTQLKVLQGEAQSAVQIGVGLLESFNAKTLLVTNITIIKI